MSEAEDLYIRRRVKDELRKRMRAVRRTVPAEARAARSAAIAERVLGLEELAKPKVLVAYLAMKGEPDTTAVIAHARAAGATIALPRVDPESGELTLHEHLPGEVLELAPFGFEQPRADATRLDAASADVVLVPAVALDERGHRIGHGKGYYDALLPDLPNARRIGMIFDFQLIAEVPITPGDEPVHVIVTDRRTIRV